MSADDASCVLSPLTVRWSGLCCIIYICVLFLLAALWDVIFTFRGSLTVALGVGGEREIRREEGELLFCETSDLKRLPFSFQPSC